MKYGLVTLCYNEERFIKPFLQHIPDWVEQRLVLVSTTPWQGLPEPQDRTAEISREMGAQVVEANWATEEQQRNTGQALMADCDWIIILDPDEFLSNDDWQLLKEWSETTSDKAGVVALQRVFYKNKEVLPHTDYQQIILVKPSVSFIENRIVDCAWGVAPMILLHFSWARTDAEVWSKISHYSHANEMDIEKWYQEVWRSDRETDLHPKTPETLKGLIKAVLPKEIKELGLWPQNQ